jgi:hypothetical protein
VEETSASSRFCAGSATCYASRYPLHCSRGLRRHRKRSDLHSFSLPRFRTAANNTKYILRGIEHLDAPICFCRQQNPLAQLDFLSLFCFCIFFISVNTRAGPSVRAPRIPLRPYELYDATKSDQSGSITTSSFGHVQSDFTGCAEGSRALIGPEEVAGGILARCQGISGKDQPAWIAYSGMLRSSHAPCALGYPTSVAESES